MVQYKNTIIGVINSGSVGRTLEAHFGVDAATIWDDDDLDAIIDLVDGLVFTGGGDVNPKRYGKNRDKSCYGIDDSRDEMELRAVKLAKERRIPIFGICRGLQLLNVAHGGTLHVDIDARPQTHVIHGYGRMHNVTIRKTSELYRWLGQRQIVGTAIHHQAIRKLGSGLTVAGFSDDGYVEAIESTRMSKQFILATQFHPEMDTHEDQNTTRALDLMEMFVIEAADYSDVREDTHEHRLDKVWDHVIASGSTSSFRHPTHSWSATDNGSSTTPHLWDEEEWERDYFHPGWEERSVDTYTTDGHRFQVDGLGRVERLDEAYMQDCAAEQNCEFAYCATPIECRKFDDCYARAVQQIERSRENGLL